MKLFIGNLSFDTTEPELQEVFEPFGPVLELVRPTDRETGRPRGFAFVTLIDVEKGREAIDKLDGTELGGRTLRVNEAEDRGHRRAPQRRFSNEVDDIVEGNADRVDDRPTDDDGKKVVYKSI